MLSFLLSAVKAKDSPELALVEPANKNALFDLRYISGKGKQYNMTNKDEGFFVAYKVSEEGKKTSDLKLFKWTDNNVTVTNDLEVRFTFARQPKTRFNFIMFNVTNNGYFPKTIDLGVFADVNFSKQGDNAQMSKRDDGRGFQVEGKPIYYTVFNYKFVTQWETEYVLPNTLFLGAMTDQETSDPLKLPYFKNESSKTTTGDTVFAFSWMNQVIPPGQSLFIGVPIRYEKDIKLPPVLTDLTEKKPYYKKGDTVYVKYRCEDKDTFFKYVMVNNSNNGKEEQTNQTKQTQDYSKTVTIGDGPVQTYTVVATDNDGLMSNYINYKFIVGMPPKFEVLEKPRTKYTAPKINIRTRITTTSKKHTIKYQFDNGRIHESSDVSFIIEIPEPVRTAKEHTLTLYAEDEYGLQSDKMTYKFTYADAAKSGGTTANSKYSDRKKFTTGLLAGTFVAIVVLFAVFLAVMYVIYKKSDYNDHVTGRPSVMRPDGATEDGMRVNL